MTQHLTRIAAALVLVTTIGAGRAAGLTLEDRTEQVRWRTWLFPRDDLTYREARRVVYSAALRLGIPTSKALAVADCESGFDETATSPSGTFRGLFQHHSGYWPGRVDAYRRYFGASHPKLQIAPDAWIYAGRPNALVAMWMVRTSGWGAWSCA